jgi:hypothetical protein
LIDEEMGEIKGWEIPVSFSTLFVRNCYKEIRSELDNDLSSYENESKLEVCQVFPIYEAGF